MLKYETSSELVIGKFVMHFLICAICVICGSIFVFRIFYFVFV